MKSLMRRRNFLKGVCVAAGAPSLSRVLEAAEPQGKVEDRPNILWITCEDMSPALGCYGDAYAISPNIDRLGAQSVRYTRAFSSASVCSPSRSCLITGVYASSLGTGNLRSDYPIPDKMKGFAALLRDAGYYCTNNIKTDYNTSNAGAIIRACWDKCSHDAHWRGRKKGQPFFAIFNDVTTHQSRSMVYSYDKFCREVQSRLAPSERHDPAKAPVPPYYPDTPVIRRTVARFHDCVTLMDKNTGALLKQLEDDGLAENTIVFFYSDHGSGLPRHKRLILDSGLHVPLLIRFPEKYAHLAPAAPGQAVDRLVSFVDFAPTMLSLLSLPIPAYMQGRAFLGKAAAQPRTHVYAARDRVDEAYDFARCVRDQNWLYVRNYMPHLSYNQPSWYSDQGEIRNEITALAAAGELQTAAQKNYAGPARPTEELYDTANDPHQIRNLAGSPEHADRQAKMRTLLRDWQDRTRDLGFLPECDLAQRTGQATPYEMARTRQDSYPLARIRAAAELVGAGPDAMDKQVKLLDDADPAVRYWAALGLRALAGQAAGAVDALIGRLGDAAPAVRIEAATALAEMGKGETALAVLVRELEGKNPDARIRSARALQMLGQKARPVKAEMERALKHCQKALQDHWQNKTDEKHDRYVWCALGPAVKALAK